MTTPRQTTTTGYQVSGCQAHYDAANNIWSGTSGRVRAIKGNPFHDEYVLWRHDGTALKHNYGDLDINNNK